MPAARIPAAKSAAAWRLPGGQASVNVADAARTAPLTARTRTARRAARSSEVQARAIWAAWRLTGTAPARRALAARPPRLRLREPDLPLALLAVERAQIGLGAGGQGRRPRRVHGAARVVAVVQVPEVAHGMDRLAREPLAPCLDRSLGRAPGGEARRGYHGLVAAIPREAPARRLAERSGAERERYGREVEDLVVGEGLDGVHLHDEGFRVVPAIVLLDLGGERTVARVLGPQPERLEERAREDLDVGGIERLERDDADHFFLPPLGAGFLAVFFSGGAAAGA